MEILTVIDTQDDFISGSLRNEEAIKAVPNIVKKIDNFDGDVIYVTQDTHDPDYLYTPEGNKLPVVHCVNRSNGWMINKDVQNALNDAYLRGIDVIYVEKPTFGSFDLIDYIKEDIDKCDEYEKVNIEFVGFCTDICVVSNVLIHILCALTVIAVAVALSRQLSGRIKKILKGYEPDIFSAMFTVRDNVLEALEEGLLAFDNEGCIVYMNCSAKKMLDLCREV